MSELKATPGPWFFLHQNGDSFLMEGPEGDDGGSIFEGGFVHADDVVNEANAHLIAAAPALYEALEDCVAVAGTQLKRAIAVSDKYDTALDKAMKALALARGETPNG